MKKLYRNLSQGWADNRERIRWYLKQLLPLRYLSHYHDADGRLHFCDWRMWFGRCFAVDDRVLSC